MKNKVEVLKKQRKEGYFYVIPVERNSVSFFAVNHNEVEGLRDYGISIDKEKASNYLYYFLLKYFDDELIENKIKMGNVSYKDKTNFEWNGKDNFYTLDCIRFMKDEMKNIIWMLENSYDSFELEEYKKKTFEKISEEVLKEELDEIIDFYENMCDYFDNVIELEDDKYIVSFSVL